MAYHEQTLGMEDSEAFRSTILRVTVVLVMLVPWQELTQAFQKSPVDCAYLKAIETRMLLSRHHVA